MVEMIADRNMLVSRLRGKRANDALGPTMRLVAVVGVVACGACDKGPSSSRVREDAANPAPIEQYVGEIDIRIGPSAAGRHAQEFGRVAGLAMDSLGRIYVADDVAHHVRVFDRDGVHVFDIGRSGRGPGEFRNGPCCITFDSTGVLWATQPGMPGGFVSFHVGVDQATHLRSIWLAPNVWPGVPLMFPPGGRLLTRYYEPSVEALRYLYFDTAGHELARMELPRGRFEDSTLAHVVSIRNRSRSGSTGAITVSIQHPFAPVVRVAHGADGRYAEVLTSRYVIALYDGDLDRTREIVQSLQGPTPSPAELDSANRIIAQARLHWEASGDRYPELEVPARRPVIDGMWFDRERRLWVRLSQPFGSQVSKADVYDADGVLLAEAEWPAGVSLTHGAIYGRIGIGVEHDELGVESVVRLRFR